MIPAKIMLAVRNAMKIRNIKSGVVHQVSEGSSFNSRFEIYPHGAHVTPTCQIGRGWLGDKGRVWLYYERDGKVIEEPTFEVERNLKITCKSCLQRMENNNG